MTGSKDTVVDHTEQHRFLSALYGEEAQLVYRVDGERLILVHTEVPDALGGRGIGGRLVRAAVDRAARTGETLLHWCPYARRWLQTHPDIASTVSIGWSDPPA